MRVNLSKKTYASKETRISQRSAECQLLAMEVGPFFFFANIAQVSEMSNRISLWVVDPRARVLPWLSVLELEPKLGPLRGSFDLQIFRVKEQLEQIVGSDWSEKCCQSFVSRYVSFAVTHGILVMRVGIFASLWVGCGFDPNSRQLQLSLIMT